MGTPSSQNARKKQVRLNEAVNNAQARKASFKALRGCKQDRRSLSKDKYTIKMFKGDDLRRVLKVHQSVVQAISGHADANTICQIC